MSIVTTKKSIVVINSRNGQMNNNDPSGKKKRFDYDDHKEEGACVIAIGGKVLSRGLTLEGLMTCYYSRNAGAYDTFFQMCRWFGYRPKYVDLCRICRLAGDPETKRSRKTCSGT